MRKIEDFVNRILGGNCVDVMKEMPSESVDLVVTDPPYIVSYRSRDGRGFSNENNDRWLKPTFAEVYRVLKADTFLVCFFGWHKADRFLEAWREAGFRTLEQLVWAKDYPSSVGVAPSAFTRRPISWPKADRRGRKLSSGASSSGATPATSSTQPRSRSSRFCL